LITDKNARRKNNPNSNYLLNPKIIITLSAIIKIITIPLTKQSNFPLHPKQFHQKGTRRIACKKALNCKKSK